MTPESVYRLVAEARAHRWGYTETLDPETLANYIRQQTEDANLRADADIVWREANRPAAT